MSGQYLQFDCPIEAFYAMQSPTKESVLSGFAVMISPYGEAHYEYAMSPSRQAYLCIYKHIYFIYILGLCCQVFVCVCVHVLVCVYCWAVGMSHCFKLVIW